MEEPPRPPTATALSALLSTTVRCLAPSHAPTPTQALPTDALALLDFLLASTADPSLLERALELVDSGRVRRCESPPGRVVMQVASSFETGGRSGDGVTDLVGSGIRDGHYTVVGGVCTCAAASNALARGEPGARPGVLCKHALAVEVALASGRWVARPVSDVEAARLADLWGGRYPQGRR